MHLTKPILRLLLAGAVSITALVAAPVAHAAAPGTKTLTVTLVDSVFQNPDASRWGRVTSSPAGIDCPGDCQEDFPHGSTVTFTLTPTPGYALGYWDLSRIGGGVQDCGENLVCTLQIGQGDAAQLTVSLRPQATLAVTPEGAGALTISPPEARRPALPPCTETFGEECSGRYPTGTRVTVTAIPDPTVPEARFVRWSDYRCPATRRSCTLTMDGEQYLTAIFEPVYLRVSGGNFGPVSISPPGVVCTFASDALTGLPAACRFPYRLNALATITRDPALAQDPPFTWTGACFGVEITCRVRMRKDQHVGAGVPPLAFTGPGQTMRFGYAGPKGGKITVSAAGQPRTCRRTCTLGGFSRDSKIRIKASGSEKVKFVRWSDVKVKKASRAIYVGDPTAVQATFKRKKRR